MDICRNAKDSYNECFGKNGRCNSPQKLAELKKLAACQKVIGSIQRYFSTPYMQALAQDEYYIVNGGRHVNLSLLPMEALGVR